MPTAPRFRVWPVLPVLLLLLAVAAGATAAPFQRDFDLDSRELLVKNMIGQVQVRPSADDRFRIQVDVQGEDAQQQLIRFTVKEGSRGEFVVGFPTDQHRRYVYPPMGSGRKSNLRYGGESGEGSWLRRVFSGLFGRGVTVTGDGNGLRIWADLVIEVPRGRVLNLEQGVGEINAALLAADLALDISSGPVTVADITGDVLVDTGSGDVQGDRIQGDVNVDTGSGDVRLDRLQSGRILMDTGSGEVRLAGVHCRSLNVDTGSGLVRAESVIADDAIIDTGSGGVYLQLERMGGGNYRLDTGSGDITLVLPPGPSARITADTGGGRVDNQVPNAVIKLKAGDQLDMTVGGGEARVILDAGSGDITVR